MLILFRDIVGGIRLGETYVYKVSALGANGELGWNSFRWSPQPFTPQIGHITITGSTLEFYVRRHDCSSEEELLITASYGLTRIVPNNSACAALYMTPVIVYGVPEGTHTLSATAHWTQSLDPNIPRLVGTSSVADTTITIKP